MLTIYIEDDLEFELNQLAKKEHRLPEQFVKDLIADYIVKQKEPELLADIMQELPTFKFKSKSLNQGISETFVGFQKNKNDLRELLKNYPVGNRSSAEIDNQINALRDEWD